MICRALFGVHVSCRGSRRRSTRCRVLLVEETIGRDAIVRLLRQRAQEVLDTNRNRVPDGSLKEKVSELVKIRDEGGYMAELGHAGRNVVEMLEHNCPIMAVAETYPEACRVERGVFQNLLGD